MARHRQRRATRGSQRWLQDLVNNCPELLDAAIHRETSEISAPIRWFSPLAGDDFSEYQDDAFLERLGVRLDCDPLDAFWPSMGPHWDALGKTDSGQIILLEAKAHTEEAGSSCEATNERSLALIRKSFKSVKAYVGAPASANWMEKFYQYANRLAHLYLLRTLNGIPAFLVNLYFLNADEMASSSTVIPKTVAEWEDAIAQQERFLGVPPQHALSRYAIHAFVDTRDISRAVKTRRSGVRNRK